MNKDDKKSFIEKIAKIKPLGPNNEVTVEDGEAFNPVLTFPKIFIWAKEKTPSFKIVCRFGSEPQLAGIRYYAPAEVSMAPYKYRFDWIKTLIGVDLVLKTQTFEFTLMRSNVPIPEEEKCY